MTARHHKFEADRPPCQCAKCVEALEKQGGLLPLEELKPLAPPVSRRPRTRKRRNER